MTRRLPSEPIKCSAIAGRAALHTQLGQGDTHYIRKNVYQRIKQNQFFLSKSIRMGCPNTITFVNITIVEKGGIDCVKVLCVENS